MINTMTKLLLLAAISLSVVSSFESFYKFRLYKDFIQNIFSKNFKLLTQRAEKQQQKDVYLDDIQASLTNINIHV